MEICLVVPADKPNDPHTLATAYSSQFQCCVTHFQLCSDTWSEIENKWPQIPFFHIMHTSHTEMCHNYQMLRGQNAGRTQHQCRYCRFFVHHVHNSQKYHFLCLICVMAWVLNLVIFCFFFVFFFALSSFVLLWLSTSCLCLFSARFLCTPLFYL